MFGAKIREVRERAGFTQRQVADRLGITPAAVSRWENDHNEPSMGQIGQMCLMFGCTTSDLIGYEMAPYSLEEQELVKMYRDAPGYLKKTVIWILREELEERDEKP